MKIRKIIFWLILASTPALSQNVPRRFEVGPTAVSLNPLLNNFYFNRRPQFEYLNGLFFRYNDGRFGYRAALNYAVYSQLFVPQKSATFYGRAGEMPDTRNFDAGFGIQYTLFKRMSQLYAFFDVTYDHICSSGGFWGDEPPSYTVITKVNGFNNYYGLGIRLTLLNRIRISPELSYCLVVASMKSQFTSLNSQEVFSVSSRLDKYSANPVIKLHLSYLF